MRCPWGDDARTSVRSWTTWRPCTPSKYVALVDGLDAVGLTDVQAFTDQTDALRWVALVDRLYDAQVRIVASGTRPLDQVYPQRCSTAATARSTCGPLRACRAVPRGRLSQQSDGRPVATPPRASRPTARVSVRPSRRPVSGVGPVIRCPETHRSHGAPRVTPAKHIVLPRETSPRQTRQQPEGGPESRTAIARVEQMIDQGNTAFVLIMAALVLFHDTRPGLLLRRPGEGQVGPSA